MNSSIQCIDFVLFQSISDLNYRQFSQQKKSGPDVYLKFTIGRGEVGKRVVALLVSHLLIQHVDIIIERCRSKSFDDNVRQVVRKQ